MILLCEDIAWVRRADGRLEPFNGERLAASLHPAIAVSGVTDPIIAESIVAAVHAYVNQCCEQRIISTTQITELVRTVLGMLGLDDVARAYTQRGQWTRIRLDQMVSLEDFELGFYRRLDTELKAVADAELELVQLCGLRACVMRLRGAQRWGAGCRSLADEIVEFVRQRVERTRPHHAGAFSLEVME